MHEKFESIKYIRLSSPDAQLANAIILRALVDLRFFILKWEHELPNFITYYNKSYCIDNGIKPRRNKNFFLHNEICFLTAFFFLFRVEEDPLYDILKYIELMTDFDLDPDLVYAKIKEHALSSLKINQKVYDFLKFKYKNLP
jgi:hypothetical protein